MLLAQYWSRLSIGVKFQAASNNGNKRQIEFMQEGWVAWTTESFPKKIFF